MATATKSKLKIFPLADRVAIRPMEETAAMKGGLYIPDTAKEKPIQGEVIAVGRGRMEKGELVPMELKVGDRVVYGKYTGSQVELEEEEIILIKESDVRSEEHTSELQSRLHLVCRLLLEKKKKNIELWLDFNPLNRIVNLSHPSSIGPSDSWHRSV